MRNSVDKVLLFYQQLHYIYVSVGHFCIFRYFVVLKG